MSLNPKYPGLATILPGERGSAMVEAAIILPLLFFLIAAIVSFAQILYARLLINDALRLAGRAAVMSPVRRIGTSGGPTCEAAAEAVFRDRMLRFGIPVGANAVNVYRERTAGAAGSPDVIGVRLNPEDVRVPCVLCSLLELSGVDYRPTTSQFVPFESEIHNCWDYLPDPP